ncbi:MAG: hypothetical protein KJT01_10600 [Gemmatimonadetes bacterium]|nr:hypothetical protein [Gemmatimonadota bacterium]
MSPGRVRRAVTTAALVLSAACDAGRPPRNELRFRTDDFIIRVASETRPVRALEPVQWRVTVHDAETGLPIQGGQGRIFATNRDRKTVANGLEETGELGTYRSNLMYVTAGMWAMAIQFRRDSTQMLQKTQDWTQDILSADEPGDFTTPQSTRVPAAPPPPASGGAAPPPRTP